MFRKLKNFDFKSKVICRFTTIFDSIKNKNERQFVDFVDERRFVNFAIAFAESENERFFVDFVDFDSVDGVKNRRLLTFNDFNFVD